jgi:hypothetical protein
MKKIIIILISLFYFTSKAHSQSAYYDSKILSTELNPDGDLNYNEKVLNILDNYVQPQKHNTYDEISKALKDNPFISLSGKKEGDNSATIARGFGNIAKSVGGLNVTNFADGLAKFLVGRAKQELSLAFFKKFKDDMEKKEYSDLRILFPHSYKALKAIDKDIYLFSAYLNTLREAFIKDFSALFEDLDKLIEQDKYKKYFDENPEIGTLAKSSLYFIDQCSRGKHPGEVLDKYAPDDKLNFSDPKVQTNIRSSTKLLQVISRSMRSNQTGAYWVPADSIRNLLESSLTRDIYLGLVYQLSDSLTFEGVKSFTLGAILKKARAKPDSLGEVVNFINQLAKDVEETDRYVSSLKPVSGGDKNPMDYYRLFETSLNILKDGFAFIDLPFIPIDPGLKAQVKQKGNTWLYIAGSAGELYVDVRNKNYSSAVLNLVTIMDTLFIQSSDPDLKTIAAANKKLMKYGTFMATVANAQSSDEVQSAIEAVSLPAGSYSVKRNSIWNVSVNGYVGIGYDSGNPFGINYEGAVIRERNNLNWNVSAMVGFAFSSGLCKDHSIGSFSAFLSVIDVGALANFRITNDSTVLDRKITVGDIFAPGLSFIYGIPKVPLSLSAGLVYKPSIAYNSSSGSFLNVPGMLRFNVSLLVDIPLMNVHTRPKM